jgi:hypothetical protein
MRILGFAALSFVGLSPVAQKHACSHSSLIKAEYISNTETAP